MNETTTIQDDAKMVVIDTMTSEVVKVGTWGTRKALRRFVDRRDNEYGAVRFFAKVV